MIIDFKVELRQQTLYRILYTVLNRTVMLFVFLVLCSRLSALLIQHVPIEILYHLPQQYFLPSNNAPRISKSFQPEATFP